MAGDFIAAAEAGQGIAIARMSLVAHALAGGTLVRPFNLDFEDGVSYFLLLRRNDAQKPMVKAFADWLRAEMAALGDICVRLRANFGRVAA